MYTERLPQISNLGDWIDQREVKDPTDGSAIDLTGWTIRVRIYRNGCDAPELEASTSDGSVTLPVSNVFQWTFRASSLSRLAPGLYEVGTLLGKDDDTLQLSIGVLPVIQGR